MKRIGLVAIVLTVLLNACKKDEGGSIDPTITISKPTEDHYHPGDTIFIEGIATDEEEMHNLEGWLVSVTTNDTLWNKSKHGHGSKQLTVNGYYVVSGVTHPNDEELSLIFWAENEAGRTTADTMELEIHH